MIVKKQNKKNLFNVTIVIITYVKEVRKYVQ